MLTEQFASCDSGAAGRPVAARSEGADPQRPAAEPGGIVGGRPAPAPAAAGPGPGGDLDASDPDRFGGLEPGEAAMDRFVSDYLGLLDGRLQTIRRCLADSDIEGARVAVLSLESSSVMVGGTALAARLGELRSQLDLGPAPQRNALLALVEANATQLQQDLRVAHG